MAKNVLSIGYDFPADVVKNHSLRSGQSLLDADIVVFRPDISAYLTSGEEYMGKPSLSSRSSTLLREDVQRWREEMRSLLHTGSTVFVFLCEPKQVYYDTGRREHSGQGRGRTTTRIVEPITNYDILPMQVRATSSSGSRVRLTPMGREVIGPYWNEFGDLSPYSAYFSVAGKDFYEPLLLTRAGDHAVGALIRYGEGALVLLPPVRWSDEECVEERDGEYFWTDAARKLGHGLLSSLLEIDKALRSGLDSTPAPEWSLSPDLRLDQEERLEREVAEKSAAIELLQVEKTELQLQLSQVRKHRRLLYETGHQLEDAVLDALRIMGFDAEQLAEGTSEFDAVFSSSDGRMLGEAEGKDNGTIAVGKLDQLERNIREDFARDGVETYAKGVLFGNAARLQSLDERGDFFTAKCKEAARRSGVALVRTPDLFPIVRYLLSHEDVGFAQQCREAIFSAAGEIVKFPEVPDADVDPTGEDDH